MDCASTTFRGRLFQSLQTPGLLYSARVFVYACWIGRLARDISVGLLQLSYSAFYTALLV